MDMTITINILELKEIKRLHTALDIIAQRLQICIDKDLPRDFLDLYPDFLDLKNQAEMLSNCGYRYPEIESYANKVATAQLMLFLMVTHGNRPRVICKDGFSVNIQASKQHYCTPREDNMIYYCSLEIAEPSQPDSHIYDYAEDKVFLLDSLYPYVPIDVVAEMLAAHGGIKISLEEALKGV